MKVCTKCKKEKSLDAFYKCKGPIDNRQGHCKECDKAKGKAWNIANPDKVKDRVRRWQSYNPKKIRNNYLKSKYNLSIEQYGQLLIIQHCVCAICNKSEIVKDARSGKLKDLAVDHCHETGKIRGLLCDRCNRGIGLLQDNFEITQSATNYLKLHGGNNA